MTQFLRYLFYAGRLPELPPPPPEYIPLWLCQDWVPLGSAAAHYLATHPVTVEAVEGSRYGHAAC